MARQRFYWPYMGTEIANYIRTKCPCIASKQPPVPEKAPLVPIMASSPFEVICIDFLHLDKSQGYEHILIVTDHFTRFSQAYATKNETSLTAARHYWQSNEHVIWASMFCFNQKELQLLIRLAIKPNLDSAIQL